MRELMAGKTCFVIAHRLSTIQNAIRFWLYRRPCRRTGRPRHPARQKRRLRGVILLTVSKLLKDVFLQPAPVKRKLRFCMEEVFCPNHF
jgi:hypothetical protein